MMTAPTADCDTCLLYTALSEAAELLYLHKNTGAARFKKIKELMGISPLTSIRDAIFMTAIYNYLNMV